MNKINYNRFFHLHTVSGIVISVGLYIIFFAGAFTLFWDEIVSWENASSPHTIFENASLNDTDIDLLLQELHHNGYAIHGRDFYLYQEYENNIYAYVYEASDSLQTNKEAYELTITHDPSLHKFSFKKYTDEKYSMGYMFYRLHYFYQLGMFGYYLAGFVSFFFLFAIVTGVIVHWKKIISNFYVFRPWAKLKTVWSDAHTALGIIGLPFQFMYALTGAMFCLYILTKQPLENLFPENESDKNSIEVVDSNINDTPDKNTYKTPLITPLLDSLQTSWNGFSTGYLEVSNYGRPNSTITAYGTLKKVNQFYHNAKISYDFTTKKITSIKDPNNLDYTQAVYEVAGNLHHADFGKMDTWPKYLLKIIYFIMTLITCFVIITGVLIWLTARDKKNVPEKQKKFNAQVGYIYIALCLTMLPVTAMAFIASKVIPESLNHHRKLILYCVFFGGWFLASLFFWMKKSNYFTNKYTLLSGGILGISIPIINGFSSGNWIWVTFANKNYNVFIFDILWLGIAISSLYIVSKIKNNTPEINKKGETQ